MTRYRLVSCSDGPLSEADIRDAISYLDAPGIAFEAALKGAGDAWQPIESATFGLGGYQDVQIGFWLTLGGKSWGVSASGGCAWALERDERCKWTEGERREALADAAMKLAATLKKAKKHAVQDLVGVPVEVTFDGNRLKDWRVLTEVL